MKSKKLEEALQYLKTSAEKTPFLLSSCGITYKELYDLLLDLQAFYDIANENYLPATPVPHTSKDDTINWNPGPVTCQKVRIHEQFKNAGRCYLSSERIVK